MTNTNLPKHIAIIMDGNGRWAEQRRLPRIAGHKAGADTVRTVVRWCAERHIEALTLFAFSSENWRRPEKEVNSLMELFVAALKREAKKLHKQNIQLRIIGDRSRLNAKLCAQIAAVEALTANNTGLKLIIATNYGGQWDITQACQQLVNEVKNGKLTSQQISAELIQSKLSTAGIPDPDLFIRTSGEQRISNFLIWQLAYAELYFTDVLWPDLTEQEMENAITFFAGRERRFGYTGEQLRETHA